MICIWFRNGRDKLGVANDVFEAFQLTNLIQKVILLEKVLLYFGQIPVIFMLNIMGPNYLETVLDPFIGQVIAAMKSFEKNRMVVLQQALHQHFG